MRPGTISSSKINNEHEKNVRKHNEKVILVSMFAVAKAFGIVPTDSTIEIKEKEQNET